MKQELPARGGFIERRWLLILFIILFLATGLRLGLMFHYGMNVEPEADGKLHYELANRIVEGEGFTTKGGPVLSRTPGYPYAISPILYLIDEPAAPRIFNLLLSLISIVLIYIIGEKLWNKRIALFAALLFAIHPSAIYYSHLLVSENIVILLNLFAVLMLIFCQRVDRTKSSILSFGAGLAFGAATLCVPSSIIAVGLSPFIIFAATKNWRKSLIMSIILVITATAVITPWMIRNYNISGRFIFIRTQSGLLLYGANAKGAIEKPYYSGRHVFRINKARMLKKAGFTEWEIDDYYRKKTFEHLKANPVAIPILLYKKFIHYWTPYKSNVDASEKWIFFVYSLPVLLLFIIGVFRTIRAGPRDSLIFLIPFLASQISCLVFWSGARFRLSIESFVLLIAAVGLFFIIDTVTKRTKIDANTTTD